MKKRILSMIVTVCMLLTMLPTAAFATGSDGDQTTLDVSKGNIVIGDGTLDAYGADGTHLTTADPDGYIITGTSNDITKTVTVTGGTQKITIQNLYIYVGDTNPTLNKTAAFQVTGGHLELTIAGANRFASGHRRAGLELSGENTSLTITASSTGSLIAGGGDYCAGIGTASSSSCGDITIAGGSISANAGYDCATQIGANSGSTCGTITITGGKFTEGSVGSNMIYGISVADGYYVSYLGDSGEYCYAVTNRAPAQIEKDNIQTVLDISKGSAHIDEKYVDAYAANGTKVTTYDPDGYVVTGTTTDNSRCVRVTGGSHKITMQNLSLNTTGSAEYPAFMIEGAKIELTLVGDNYLTSRQFCPGLAVMGADSSLTITKESTGTLTATGGAGTGSVVGAPGIGGVASYGVCGDITIEGGSINAVPAEGCNNAIGAANEGTSGTITITGGNFATGDATANTIYGIGLPAGYQVVQGTGDFPYQVVANACTVTLKANGIEVADIVVNDVIGYYTLPACPFQTPDGKYFKGWAETSTGAIITDASILVNADTELYAVWDDVYTVSFEANGGTGSMSAVTLNGVSNYTLPECTFTAPGSNYSFMGWSTTSTGDSLLGSSIEVNANTTIYAIWGLLHDDVEINQKNFPDAIFRAYVNENLDGDKNGRLSNIEIKNTTEISISSKGITDLTGIEYFTALTLLNCTQNNLTSLDLSKNVLLNNTTFGGWGNTYDITVDSVGRTFDLTNLPGKFDVSKTSGWMTETYSTVTVNGNTLTVPFDFSSQTWASTINYSYSCGNNLTATFTLNITTADNTYTLSFDKNGGTGEMASKSDVAGNIAMPACTFTAPAGKQFKGWAIAANGEVISGTTITVSASTTLYAIWEDIPVVTKYQVTVTDGTASVAQAAEGDTVTITANAAPEGRQFTGWQVVSGGVTLADATQSTTTFTMPADAVEIKAVYKTVPTIAFASGYNPSKTYDGQPISNPTAADLEITGAEYSDVVFTWTAKEGSSLTDGKPVNAGDYTLTATIPATDDREEASVQKDHRINKALVDGTIYGQKVANSSLVEQRISLPALPDGARYEVSKLYLNSEVAISDHFTKLEIDGADLVYIGKDSMTVGDTYDVLITVVGENHTGTIDIEMYVIAHTHSGGEATCTELAICEGCTQTYGALNPANHAESAEWTQTATTHAKAYTCCGAVVVAEETHEWENGVCTECGYGCAHTGGTATCTDKAVCTGCGHEYGEKDADNHASNDFTYTSNSNGTHKKAHQCCGVEITASENCTYGTDRTCGLCGYTKPSSGGSSSGGSSSTTTTTEKNDDGSTTTTTTNKVTGTVTETTKNTDGSTETVETKKDGTVTTTVKDSDGSTTKTVETPDGTVEAEATVSNKAGNEIVADAKESGASQVVIAPEIPGDATKTEVSIPASTVGSIGSQTDADLTVSTPVADVSIPNGGLADLAHEGGQVTVTAEKSGNTVELTVTAGRETVTDLPGGITLTVPVEDAAPGTVAVLVKEDGSREVIRKSVSDDGEVSIPLSGSATVELIDNSKDFTDTKGHWASEAIDFVTARGLYAGTSVTTFTPDGSMTRAMLARVLHNLESNPGHAFEGTFHDLDGHWATDSIHWAADRGIVDGYPDGSYGADDSITREQLAVMLWRYAGSPETDHGLDHFKDAGSIASYARMALAWANENGIIGGIGNNTLDPKGDATRAQVATMLMRMMQQM